MTPRDLRRAAAILRREARAIKESHSVLDDWDECASGYISDEQRDHDEMLDLAAKLETCAKSGDSCTRPARRVKETTA